MFVNAVNHQFHTPKQLTYLNNKTTVQRNSNKNNSDALLSQLSFMGLQVPAKILPRIDLSFLPQSYRENLIPFRLQGYTILGKRPASSSIIQGGILLLDKPLRFADAIPALGKYIDNFGFNLKDIPFSSDVLVAPDDKMELWIYRTSFDFYKQGIEQVPELKDIPIKGIIGQGGSSTCFLTTDNTVLKLSEFRNFPLSDEFIEGVDIPVLGSKVINTPLELFVAHVPFAEEASLIDTPLNDFLKIRQDFYQKIKKINPNYNFHDFNDTEGARAQVGFVDGQPYLLDPQCIVYRTGLP